MKKFREAKKECDILYMLDRESYNNIDYCINQFKFVIIYPTINAPKLAAIMYALKGIS